MKIDKELLTNKYGAMPAKAIIMFLVVIVIFCGVFGTIASNLEILGNDVNVSAIPGATIILGIVGLAGILIILMYALREAGLI